jgi:hypothetical protein
MFRGEIVRVKIARDKPRKANGCLPVERLVATLREDLRQEEET